MKLMEKKESLKFIFTGIYFGLLVLPAITNAAIDPQKKITNCLIDVYTQQSFYQNKFEKYSANLEDLMRKKNNSCNDIKVSILRADQDEFEASGELNNSKWTVDSNKKFQKIR